MTPEQKEEFQKSAGEALLRLVVDKFPAELVADDLARHGAKRYAEIMIRDLVSAMVGMSIIRNLGNIAPGQNPTPSEVH